LDEKNKIERKKYCGRCFVGFHVTYNFYDKVLKIKNLNSMIFDNIKVCCYKFMFEPIQDLNICLKCNFTNKLEFIDSNKIYSIFCNSFSCNAFDCKHDMNNIINIYAAEFIRCYNSNDSYVSFLPKVLP
jgi:hypothetical protein